MNRRAFVLGAAMVLAGNLVAVALRSFAEARFLAAYGAARVPWLAVANAGGFAIATLGYDALTRRARAATVDFALLALLGVAAVAAPAELRAGAPPVVLVVALAAMSQVAGLALWNRVAASVAGRDARRMLPRAGAAVTAGGVIAGLGAAPLILRFGADLLPYLGAGVTALALVLAIAQDRALAAGGAPGATVPPGTSGQLSSLQRRLLGALLVAAILEGLVATVIDLQFAQRLKARYHGDDLAAAVALFYGCTNLVLLLVQVAAVPRLLVTRSLPTTLLISPLLVLGSYVAFAVAPGFGAIATTRTAEQVLRAATSRTGQEVSLSALPPGPRARWKVLLRGAVWPIGAALAAFALLLVGPTAVAHPTHVAVVVMGIGGIWAAAGQRVARRFQAALAAPLGIRATRIADPTRIDLATLEQWTMAAGSADEPTAALARAALARARVAPSDLADHLRHDDPAVRAALFEQLARTPDRSVRAELRAATLIEEDDRAFGLGLEAMAIAGDDAALARGASRGELSRELAAIARSAELTLHGGAGLDAELVALCARDPVWAIALLRSRGSELDAASTLRTAAAAAAARPGALAAIAAIGPTSTLAILGDALVAGEAAAQAAIAGLDDAGAIHLATHVVTLGAPARLAIARALAGTPAGAPTVAALLADGDGEVASAALRTALAVARGGGALPAAPIAAAYTGAIGALAAHLDARDAAAAQGATWTACAATELEIATRGCVARLLWAAAVEAVIAGRDASVFAATARRLVAGRDADRRRALDVVQELQSGRTAALAALERWIVPPRPDARAYAPGSRTTMTSMTPILAALALHDPWLAALGRGELAASEPVLAALRRPALFATTPGPALASLAGAAERITVDGLLFSAGDVGDSMFVVAAGALHAVRDGAPPRLIEVGGVVGELAVLSRADRAVRAATITSIGPTELIVIRRADFATAARRAPELLLGLSATLAGWLAANRPDLLG